MGETTGIYSGKATTDGTAYREWFIGRFVTDNPVRRSEDVEVKLSVHTKPFCETRSTANKTATSMSLLISGSCIYMFKDQAQSDWTLVTLSEHGQYVIWLPGVLHSLKVDTSCEMVVVRWPSPDCKDKIEGPTPWAESDASITRTLASNGDDSC